MLNQRYQYIFIMAVGLWLTAFTGFCRAEEPANSKSLAHYIMAVIHDLDGDNEKAMDEYKKSAQLDRQQPLPHLRLGSYYARMGRFEEASKELKAVIKLTPDSYQAHYLMALIYSSQKKYDLAAGEYEAVLKTASRDNPDNIEIHAYLAQLYYALHKNSQAITQLNQILEIQPKNMSALYLLGSIDLEINQREKAKEQFRAILSLQPDHDGALNSLAYIYAEDGANLDEALKMARKAVDLDPASGAYYDTLGWVLFKQGFHTESLMALQKALEYSTDPLIYEHMGDVYKSSNDPGLARKSWLKALALDSRQPKISEKLQQLNHSSAKIQAREESNTTK